MQIVIATGVNSQPEKSSAARILDKLALINCAEPITN